MSRLGKYPITIPDGIEVTRDGREIRVKGPKGELSREFREGEVDIAIDGSAITVTPKRNSKFARSLWGTYASHLTNMINGVTNPFEKKLRVEGVGYKVELSGNILVLSVGFSHKVEISVPEDIIVAVEKNEITVSGIDKEKVGKFAAQVRAVKKPEPYKGKGIRYEGEVVRMKEGKKTA